MVVLIKILQITKYFYPAVSFGGPIQCTYNISRNLVKAGHEVTVFATNASDLTSKNSFEDKYRLIDGINVFFVPNIIKAYGFFFSPGIIKLLKNLDQFDIVHLHEYRTFQNLAFFILNNSRIPYVLSCHGEFIYRQERFDHILLRRSFENLIGKKIINNASCIFALNESEKNQYLSRGVNSDKIVKIPNGISSSEFSIEPIFSFKKILGISGPMLLYIGRIHKRKGIDTIIRAFIEISKIYNSAKLVISGPDDGYLFNLKELVKYLKLDEKVTFTGSLNRKQVIAAYKDAEVVIYPSIQEGFPLVPLEAGFLGKPVIVSDDPGMDFVRQGDFGLTIEYNNVKQLIDSIKRILDNPDFANELGKKGRKYVSENFLWENIAKKIEKLYSNVISNFYSD